jgi:hypothetical protein
LHREFCLSSVRNYDCRPSIHPVERIETRDWLAFAGIEGSQVQLIAREQQFAEKIHAYTLPHSATKRLGGYGAPDRRQHIGSAEDS